MSKPLPHQLRVQGRNWSSTDPPDPDDHAQSVRSWLTALVGTEHLSLLIGSGFSTGIAVASSATPLKMGTVKFTAPKAAEVDAHADRTAKNSARGSMNIEDQLRSALQLLGGLEVAGSSDADEWRSEIERVLTDFASGALAAEKGIRQGIESGTKDRAHQLLIGFLLAFASRPPSRERLNAFTTNYDRVIEYGCDLGGLRVIDRFVGAVEPIFRSSRVDVDLHYSPPGIRGEPRYLEGVIRVAKLHGSLDWRFDSRGLYRVPLGFGADGLISAADPLDRLMIYPNAAKDVETLQYPYAELFRDLSAALCRPNGVLVTYGYGFGDDHINRVIRDMLTLRSTHLLVISYDDASTRIGGFLSTVAPEQYSLLLGAHFGDLANLVDHYLPRPGSEQLLLSEADRLKSLGIAYSSAASVT